MSFVLQPWQLLVVILTGWLNRQQQAVIDFLRTEVHVLKETHGKRRIRLSDDQRRRLAIKGKALGRQALQQIATLVTPDTILRWHRQLVAATWDYSSRRKTKPGRPPVPGEVTQLILRMARENPTWGYDRIQGALANLGHRLSDTTVGNILKAHGIEPAPRRKHQTTWKTFIKAHCEVLAAIDFTIVEVWTPHGEESQLSGKCGGDWEIQGNVGRGLQTRSRFKRLDFSRSAIWLWYVAPAIVVPRSDKRFRIVDAAQLSGRLVQAALR